MSIKVRFSTRLRDAYAYRHEPECARIIADACWRYFLLGALALMCVSALYGGIEFFRASRDVVPGAGTKVISSLPALTKMQLQNTLGAFEARAARFEELKASAPSIADPSK